MSNKTNKYRRSTVTGRIVYPRAKHLFSFSDVYRVLIKVSKRNREDYMGILSYFIKEFFNFAIAKIRKEDASNYYLEEKITSFVKNMVFNLIYELFNVIQISAQNAIDVIKSIVWQLYQTFK